MKYTADEFIGARLGLVPADHKASAGVDGTGIDCKGYDECLVVLNSGTNTSTGTLDVIVEESTAVGGTYVAITGAVFTQIVAANDNTLEDGDGNDLAALIDFNVTNNLGIPATAISGSGASGGGSIQ